MSEPSMPCNHPGCGAESTRSIARWVTPDHLAVDYYCDEHSPAGATRFEDDDEYDEDEGGQGR